MVVRIAYCGAGVVDILEPACFFSTGIDRQLDVQSDLRGTCMAQRGQAPNSCPSCTNGHLSQHIGRTGACAFGLGIVGIASLGGSAGLVHHCCSQVMADGPDGLDLRRYAGRGSGVRSMVALRCRVCGCENTRVLLVDREGRKYHRCEACAATFLDPSGFPSAEAELAHYLTHENDVTDQAYRNYLAKLVDPLLAQIRPKSAGLDFGCGPAAALAAMVQEAGHTMSIYDPVFASDAACLDAVYDFVTCTETVEHFHYPDVEFNRLCGLVRPGGLLAVMTIFQTDDALFERWRYRYDPTHVVFYKEQTFSYLAAKLGMKCQILAKDVVFLTKPG